MLANSFVSNELYLLSVAFGEDVGTHCQTSFAGGCIKGLAENGDFELQFPVMHLLSIIHFALLCLLPGVLIVSLFEAGKTTSSEFLVRGLLLSTILTSAISLTLLVYGIYSFPLLLLTSGTITILLLTFAIVRGTQWPKVNPLYDFSIFFLLLGTLGVAAALRFPGSNFLYGGQDPGVYANLGHYIARQGSSIVVDRTFQEINDPELRSYYMSRSYRSLVEIAPGQWIGHLVPGLYLKDVSTGRFTPQFYHLHPLWLALGSEFFGRDHASAILGVLSVFTVLLVFLLGRDLTGSSAVGAFSALLIAVSPAHSYFAKFPVSETVAGFFFLAGVYSYIESRERNRLSLFISALSFGCFFFTRITGFMILPLFLAVTGYRIIVEHDRSKVRTLSTFLLGLYLLYIGSFYYGLNFSKNYSQDIYRGKLGIQPLSLVYAPYVFAGAALLYAGMIYALRRFPEIIRVPAFYFSRYRGRIAIALIAGVLLAIAYRGYLLGFTDHYLGHKWFGRRWKVAGTEWKAVQRLTLTVLYHFMSPVGFFAFLGGLVLVLRRSFFDRRFLFLGFSSLFLFSILSFQQLIVPYLYYFSRYLVSELLPLMIIVSAYGALSASKLLRFRGATALVTAAYLFSSVTSLLPSTLVHARTVEGTEFVSALDTISNIAGKDGIIFIDKKFFAETPIVPPLRLTYTLPTFSIRRGDFPEPEKLRELMSRFNAEGKHVILISSQIQWNRYSFLNRVTKITAKMRTFKGSPDSYLPDSRRVRAYPIRVYEFNPGAPNGGK